jgi:hypothetical protein
MQSIVLSSLLPVILLIAIGFIAGRADWIRATALKDLGSLVFSVLTPALLFRTMSTVHVERLDFKPVLAYRRRTTRKCSLLAYTYADFEWTIVKVEAITVEPAPTIGFDSST